jgi:hypothetical protein
LWSAVCAINRSLSCTRADQARWKLPASPLFNWRRWTGASKCVLCDGYGYRKSNGRNKLYPVDEIPPNVAA